VVSERVSGLQLQSSVVLMQRDVGSGNGSGQRNSRYVLWAASCKLQASQDSMVSPSSQINMTALPSQKEIPHCKLQAKETQRLELVVFDVIPLLQHHKGGIGGSSLSWVVFWTPSSYGGRAAIF